MMAKKCTKKRDARAKLLFVNLNLLLFLPFQLLLTLLLLRVLSSMAYGAQM